MVPRQKNVGKKHNNHHGSQDENGKDDEVQAAPVQFQVHKEHGHQHRFANGDAQNDHELGGLVGNRLVDHERHRREDAQGSENDQVRLHPKPGVMAVGTMGFGHDINSRVERCPPTGSNQVEQRKQENPHDVHKVPVEAGQLDHALVLGAEPAHQGHEQNDGEHDQTAEHVQGVKARHGEITGSPQVAKGDHVLDRQVGMLFEQGGAAAMGVGVFF